MPQLQSSRNPFAGDPRGPNREYWESTQGIAPQPIGGFVRGGPSGGGPSTPAPAPTAAAPAPQPLPFDVPALPQPITLDQLPATLDQLMGLYQPTPYQQPPQYQQPQPAPAPMQIQSGIQQPQLAGPAPAPSMPSAAPFMSAGAQGAGQQAYEQAIQPMQMQQAGEYYQQAGPLDLAAQQAQGQSGLGWAGLAEAMRQQQILHQQQQMSDFLRQMGAIA